MGINIVVFRWLYFISTIKMMIAVNKIYNIRYSTTYLQTVEDFSKHSEKYNKALLLISAVRAIPESQTQCIGCTSSTDLISIEPAQYMAETRIFFQVKVASEHDRVSDLGIYANKKSVLDVYTEALKHGDPRFIASSVVVTHPFPTACKRVRLQYPGYEWLETEAGATRSMLYPRELNKNIRSASRVCKKSGWGPVNLYFMMREAKICDVKGLDADCKPLVIERYEDAVDKSDDEIGQTLGKILKVNMESGKEASMSKRGINTVLSFIKAMKKTGRIFHLELLSKVRETIEIAYKSYKLSGGSFKFESSHFAMMIMPIKDILSKTGIVNFHVNYRKTKKSSIETINIIPEFKTRSRYHGDITIPVKSMIMSLPEDDPKPDRIGVYVDKAGFNFGNASLKLLSNVYSVLVPGMEDVTLKQNITLTFDRPVMNETSGFELRCVFWDQTKFPKDDGWSTEGCSINFGKKNHVDCRCNHLSSFALMTLPAVRKVHEKRLQWISIIGCTVSAIALILTLLTYLSFKLLRSELPSKILVFICFNLLFTNLLYILNVFIVYKESLTSTGDKKESMTCKFVALLFHYFLLSSLAWMGANGYFMYKSLVDVFDLSKANVRDLAIFASGLPTLVVLGTAIIGFHEYYGLVKNEICWLQGSAATYTFIGPVVCLTVFNAGIFMFVLSHIVRISRSERRSSIKPVITQFKGGVSMTILLGLTWSFAFMAVGWGDIVFAYLFVTCNSFQGFFLFLFYCAFKDKVRYFWMKTLKSMRKVEVLTTTIKTHETTATAVDFVQTAAEDDEDEEDDDIHKFRIQWPSIDSRDGSTCIY